MRGPGMPAVVAPSDLELFRDRGRETRPAPRCICSMLSQVSGLQKDSVVQPPLYLIQQVAILAVFPQVAHDVTDLVNTLQVQ